MPFDNIPVTERLNADGTVNYFRWKYKGSEVKIAVGYDEFGNINQLHIPTFLNMSHKELLNALMALVPVANPTRSGWYDRNSTSIIRSFWQTLIPGPETERWTYTCPVNRKAMVESLDLFLGRITVAAPVGRAGVYVTFTPAGGAATNLVFCSLYDNNVGAYAQKSLGQGMLMQPGEVIRGLTFDASNGGTIEFMVAMKVTEFDA